MTTTHVTPAEIRTEITRVLAEDFQKNSYGGQNIPIPVRVEGLIDEAFKRAFAKAEAGQ